jgi:hypothetical protein
MTKERIAVPGTSLVMMLRNSERSTFKTCRHRWQWTYLDGRQSIDAPHALRFGDLVHRSLDRYYRPGVKRGRHPALTFEKLYVQQAEELKDRGFNVYSEDKWVEAGDLGPAMLRGYVDEYKDRDSEWEIIASELTFQRLVRVQPRDFARLEVEPPREALTARGEFRFKAVGTFDGVWRHRKNGRIIFREFKTAAQIKLDGLPMDEQASMYWTFGPSVLRRKGILEDGQSISEIGYRFLRKAAPNPDKATDEMGRVLNKDGSISKTQPRPYFAEVPVYRDEPDRDSAYKRIVTEAVMIARARFGLEPLIKNPGPLHMPNCMGCAVKDACEAHETGADFNAILNMTMQPWDPYAAHELPERK